MSQSIISLSRTMCSLVLLTLLIQIHLLILSFVAGDPQPGPFQGQCRSILFKFLLVKHTFLGNSCADMCRSAYSNFEYAVDNLRAETNVQYSKKRKSQSKHGQPYMPRSPEEVLDVCVPQNARCFNGQREVYGDLNKISAPIVDPRNTCQSAMSAGLGCSNAVPRPWLDYNSCSCIKSLLLFSVRSDNFPTRTAETCFPDMICTRLAETISSKLTQIHNNELNFRESWQCFGSLNPPSEDDPRIQIIDPTVPCTFGQGTQPVVCKHCNPRRCASSSSGQFLDQCPQLEPFDPATYKTYKQWKSERSVVPIDIGEASSSQMRPDKRPRGIAFGDKVGIPLKLAEASPAQQNRLNLDRCLGSFSSVLPATKSRDAAVSVYQPGDSLQMQLSIVNDFHSDVLDVSAGVGPSNTGAGASSSLLQPTEMGETQVCPCTYFQDEEDVDDYEGLYDWLNMI